MDLFDTTQIGLGQALSGASLRQQAIASNIANANTPGYVREDVDFSSALQSAWDQGSTAVGQVRPAIQSDTAAMRADGSSVDIDTEAAAQAQNGLQYQAIADVFNARTAILKSAIGVA